jgi:hypothetical protein
VAARDRGREVRVGQAAGQSKPSAWHYATQTRVINTDEQAALFMAYVEASATLKEAAWLARIPERTARRWRKRVMALGSNDAGG